MWCVTDCIPYHTPAAASATSAGAAPLRTAERRQGQAAAGQGPAEERASGVCSCKGRNGWMVDWLTDGCDYGDFELVAYLAGSAGVRGMLLHGRAL